MVVFVLLILHRVLIEEVRVFFLVAMLEGIKHKNGLMMAQLF